MDWDRLVEMNPHWAGEMEVPSYRREVFWEALDRLERARWVLQLAGPRRVGKTTVMKQLMAEMLHRGVGERQILYLLLERGDSIREALRLWKEAGGDPRKESYLFLDEVQYVQDWGQEVKYLYDTFPRMHIVVSGSASLLVRKGSESLAGRMWELEVGPLSFQEYLDMAGRPVPEEADSLWREYQRYLKRQLPEAALGLDPVELVRSIISKVLGEDLLRLFGVRQRELAEALLRLVLKEPGVTVNYDHLARELGFNRATVSKYMNAMAQAFLLRKVYHFSRNALKVEKRLKRYYPFYASLTNYIHPFHPPIGKLLEADVFEKLGASFYYREGRLEVDVVLPECMVGVEVKTSKKIAEGDLRGLFALPLRKAFVVAPPTSRVLARNVEVVPPHRVGEIRRACGELANSPGAK